MDTRFRHVITLAMVALMLLTAANVAAGEGWTSFRNDIQGTGYQPGVGPVTGNVLWYGDLCNGGIFGSILADDGRLYLTTGGVWSGHSTITNPKAFCIDANDGTVIWSNSYPKGTYEIATPALSDDLMIVPCSAGMIIALDRDDGHEVWRFDVGNPISGWIYGASTPVIEDGLIYFGTSLGEVYCLDLDGNEVWCHELGEVIRFSAPSIGYDALYIGAKDGSLHAIALDGSGELWSVQMLTDTNAQVPSTPLLLDDRIVFIYNDGGFVPWVSGIAAVDYDGNLLWSNQSIGTTSSSVSLTPQGALVFSSDHGVWAFDEDGGLLWQNDVGALKGSPAVSDNGIYVTEYAAHGSTFGLSLDGEMIWEMDMEPATDIAYSMVSSTLYDGRLYTANDDGMLFCIGDLETDFSVEARGLYVELIADAIEGGEYAWDMGDGTWANGTEVTHLYPHPGHYTVSLMSENGTALMWATRTLTLEQLDAGIIMSVDGKKVTLVACEKNATGYTWELDDGSTYQGEMAIHNFTTGQHEVRLTVTGPGGQTVTGMGLVAIEDTSTAIPWAVLLLVGTLGAAALLIAHLFRRGDLGRAKLVMSAAFVVVLLVSTTLMVGIGISASGETVSVLIDTGDEHQWISASTGPDTNVLDITVQACSQLGITVDFDHDAGGRILRMDGLTENDEERWWPFVRLPGNRTWAPLHEDLDSANPFQYDAIGWAFGVEGCRPFVYPGPTVDLLGDPIFIGGVPSRVVCTAPSVTETLCAVGAFDLLVGVSQYCDYPFDVTAEVADGNISVIGSFTSPSYEMIIEAAPDLVLCYGGLSSHIDVGRNLKDNGIETIILYPGDSVDEVFDNILIVGQLVGRTSEAEMLIAEMCTRIDAISELASDFDNAPRVLVSIGMDVDSASWVAGQGTYVHDLIVSSGGINIFDDSLANNSIGLSWFQASKELVMERDPEIIIITCDDPLSDPEGYYDHVIEIMGQDEVWSRTTAYLEGRVHVINQQANNVFSRSGPRVADAMDLMVQMIHPEMFETELPLFLGNDYVDYLKTDLDW